MSDTDHLDSISENSSGVPDPSNTSIGRSATLLSLGNVAGRALGLLREMVIAAYFGAAGEVSAFRAAAQVPTLVYDLLAGGMLSAALVPTLSEYTTEERRQAFVKLAGSLISLFALLLAIILLLLELFAPQVALLMASGFAKNDPSLILLTERLLRLVLPAVWLISMAGIIMGILYAQKRFAFPAMAAAVFNLGVVVATPIFAPWLGISSLAVGILLGSTAQLGVMAWDLRRFLSHSKLQLPFRIIWEHPALRKMVRLYLPIAGVTAASSAQIALDRNLASGTGEQSIAWMYNATTLQQLPLGLISIAIALAALPRLSQFYAEGDNESYRQVLGHGLRLVILLIVPAAVGLWLLDEQIVRLIFERGNFLPEDSVQVMSALSIYVIGMLFAAIDNPLNYAFYARNNTLLPAIAGLASIVVYVIAAYALVGRMGFLGLVWADTIKHGSHVLFMSVALGRSVGLLKARLAQCGIQTLIAAGGMATFIWYGQGLLNGVLWNSEHALADLVQLVTLGGGGILTYGLVLFGLNVSEARDLTKAALRRIGR